MSRLVYIATLFFSPLSTISFAQSDTPLCTGTDTLATCTDKLVENFNGDVVEATVSLKNRTENSINNAVVSRNTGESDSIGGKTTTVTEDFLKKIGVSLISNGGTPSDNDASVFEITDFLGLNAQDGYKATVSLNEAKLYKPVESLLREADQVAQADQLSEALGDFDSVGISFSYSPVGNFIGKGQWGRDPDAYDSVTRSLIDRSIETLQSQENFADTATTSAYSLFREYGANQPGNDEKPLQEVLPDKTQRDEFIEKLETAVKAEEAYFAAYTEAVNQSGVFSMESLIDNQPQLNFTINGTVNDRLAGPDDISLKLTYEHGLYNVNRMLSDCSMASNDFTSCYRAFVTDNKAAIEDGNRLSFSLEYQQTNKFQFNLPEENISFESQKAKTLIAGLSWGRYIGNRADGNTRIEVQIAYEDVSGDPTRQGRGLASAIFSHTLAPNVRTTVGLIYANKPEFRGDVDKELSARLGLNYSLDTLSGQP